MTRITTSDGVSLFISIQGSGQPCLYLHGGPGSGSYWMEKFSAGLLEKHYQMIYLDQRGVGRSTSPADGNFGLERMVQDFEEVREGLGITRWLTMGHSFGGILQVGYALRRPNAQQGLVMLNAVLDLQESFRSSWAPSACAILGLTDTAWYLDETVPVGERMSRLAEQMRERGLFWKMAYADPRSEAAMNATFGEIPDWNWDFSGAFLDYPEYFASYSAATAQVGAPVLFFYGLHDHMIGPDHYRLARFPNQLLWPSAVGHVAVMENRADLDRALAAFQRRWGG